MVVIIAIILLLITSRSRFSGRSGVCIYRNLLVCLLVCGGELLGSLGCVGVEGCLDDTTKAMPPDCRAGNVRVLVVGSTQEALMARRI